MSCLIHTGNYILFHLHVYNFINVEHNDDDEESYFMEVLDLFTNILFTPQVKPV